MILYNCEAEALSRSLRPRQSYSVMVKWRCFPELVQIHGFRSVEVLLDTPPGSPENCPDARGGSVQVQISLSRPVSLFMVKPRFPLSLKIVSQQEAELSGHLLADLLVVMLVLQVFPRDCASSVMPTEGAKPAQARHVLSGLVFPRPRIQRVQGNPLFAGSGRLRETGSWPMVLTLSPKVVDIKAMRLLLLEARSWQEAKSNLVTVCLALAFIAC
ncbi:hypothetical protein YC2023_018258 [Brassica napus]